MTELQRCLAQWDSGHTCDKLAPHDGPHVCQCGIPLPNPQEGIADDCPA